MSSRPLMGVDVRISPGERRAFSAWAPSLTRASSLNIGRAEGSVEPSLELV